MNEKRRWGERERERERGEKKTYGISRARTEKAKEERKGLKSSTYGRSERQKGHKK